MNRSEAEQKLKEIYRVRKGLRDAFHEESVFVEFHLEYIEKQCGGAWGNEAAAKLIDSFSRNL